MRRVFEPEWRTSSRRKRRFYSKYMTWLERIGYLVVLAVVAAFLVAFNYPVDDLVVADEVKLAPASVPLKTQGPTLVARALAEDFAEVRAGQPLLEVVEGEEAIRAYGQWAKVDALRAEIGDPAEVQRLSARYPKPATRVLTAPTDGTFRYDPKVTTLEADAEVGRVVNYGDVRLSASLKGDTVAKAQVGQWARITSLNLGPGSGVIFRGSSPRGAVLSNQIVGEPVRAAVAESLRGVRVRLRDDVPLQVADVAEVQVDARVSRTEGGAATNAVSLDPPTSYVLRAQVVEGTPAATVQVVDLPPDVERRAREAIVAAVRGRQVRDLDGRMERLGDVSDVRLLVKLQAEPAAGTSSITLAGTPLKRTYEATLQVQSPPAFLVQALRDADRNGEEITARVELRTGSRPIAFILLKKS